MNFNKELKIMEDAQETMELAEKQVMVRFRIEVMNMIAKYKKYNYEFVCGNGTFFFTKNDVIIHDEEKLPPDMKALCDFLEEHHYIQRYLYNIQKGVVSMKLENNPHLKEVESILDNWDKDKGYLTTNDIHGVDLIAPINLKELGIEGTDEELIEKLELHYDGSDYFFRHDKDDYHEVALVISSCEEIFITYEGELCFPDMTSNSIKLSRENREIEIIAYSLDWMNDNGCFSGIYQLDYYSNSPEEYKFYDTDEYKALGLSEDEKIQAKEISRLVDIVEFTRQLEEQTQTLGELPCEFYEALPTVLQESDGEYEVLKVDSFDAHTMTIQFEAPDYEEFNEAMADLMNKGRITQGDNDLSYNITLSLLPNSVKFLKGLDDMLGLTTKEVA